MCWWKPVTEEKRWHCLAVTLDRRLEDIALLVFICSSCTVVIQSEQLAEVTEWHFVGCASLLSVVKEVQPLPACCVRGEVKLCFSTAGARCT